MEGYRNWDCARINNVGLAAGTAEKSPALLWGLGVRSAFDDRVRSVWSKSQVFRFRTDLILGNFGSSQGWGGERRRERLPVALPNASGGQDTETQGKKRVRVG